MRELHLFAGIGGGILAGEMLGHRPVCAVEIDPFCQEILRHHWPELPIHGDIRTFPASDWAGQVDVVAGGFPCQDISAAGKGAGLEGARSGLWFQMLRVVCDVRPRYVFVENSPLLRSRGLDIVLGGLASLGFDAAWEIVSAEDVGAPHLRKRMWVLAAHPDRLELRDEPGRSGGESGAGAPFAGLDGEARNLAHPDRQRLEEQAVDALRQDGSPAGDALVDRQVADAGSEGLPIRERSPGERAHAAALRSGWWDAEPELGRVVDGAPNRVDRLRALGNAQVPLQAATAFRRLLAALKP